MIRTLLLFLSICLSVFAANACCSSSDKSCEPETPVDTAIAEGSQAPVMTPYTLTLKGVAVEQGNRVTLEIVYNQNVRVETKLSIKAVNGTFLKNIVKYRSIAADQSLSSGMTQIVEILPPAERGAKVVRDVVISGEDASVQARVLLSEEGLSFEMRESWPEEPLEELPEISSELEHPIQVEGVVIDRSVNVKPKRPSLPKAEGPVEE